MPKIPISIDDLPTSLPELDDNIPYHGICRQCKLSDTPDKNGNMYLTGIYIEVTEPEEFKGRTVSANYLPMIIGRSPSGNLEVMFQRFIKCFKVPYDSEGFDPQDAIGCEGDFTIQNDEYQGQSRPRVKDFLM